MIVPLSSRALVASHNGSLEFTSLAKLSSANLLAEVDLHRAVASLKLRQDKKVSMGQFLTPASVAQLMAGMFNRLDLPEISLLDAGAGIGSLLAAFVAKVCQHRQHTSSLRVVAYEIDPFLIGYLHQTLKLCERECEYVGISFNYEIRETDFIEDAVRLLQIGLLNSANATEFTHAILNPPYLKINAHSQVRELLRSIGLETSNLYTGFMTATAQLLKPSGEFVAITPRSFCNGPYFRDFRKMFLEMMALEQLHLFESRQEAFSDLISAEPRKKYYLQKREMSGISIVINEKIKTLSPGGQNILIEKIIKDFVPRFTPSGKVIYVGDTAKKLWHFDKAAFVDLGVNIDSHGKIPDVIIHFTTPNWLVLIEAVTSQGAINPKRKEELEVLFRGVQIPLVMVTTFLSRKAMKKYLPEIAWETDVWVAEDSTHLIHFNGEYSKLQAYQIEM
ncbi:BsuBI/PstI family type II restriction endonuclease [Nostoc sp.]|uniref:BsuBI/PstI family type II restriction endonuclease n=1 Tax=Nostoc sp. TaxID=1180 RepID=UPI002FFCCA69